MKKHTLEIQRQGSGTSLNARLYLDKSKKTYYLVEIHYHYRDKKPRGHIFYVYPRANHGIEQQTIEFISYSNLSDLLRNAITIIKNDYMWNKNKGAIEIEVQDYIESYCYPSGHDSDYVVNSKYPELRELHDKYKAVLVYCPYSNTIRHAISNICVCSFNNKETIESINFNWQSEYGDILRETFVHNYNGGVGCIKNASLQYNAGWLVSLFNSQMLEDNPKEKYKLMRSLINGINYGSFMYSMPREGRLVADYNSHKKAGSHQRKKKVSDYSPCQLDDNFTSRYQ